MSPQARHQHLLEQEKLCFQACSDCGNVWLPPRGHCPDCLGNNWQWQQSGGAARLVSFVVYHRAFHESVKHDVPYAVGIIELREGPRLISRIEDASPNVSMEERFGIGQEMALNWTRRDGATLPVFVPNKTN